jgi:hypothetical protein
LSATDKILVDREQLVLVAQVLINLRAADEFSPAARVILERQAGTVIEDLRQLIHPMIVPGEPFTTRLPATESNLVELELLVASHEAMRRELGAAQHYIDRLKTLVEKYRAAPVEAPR